MKTSKTFEWVEDIYILETTSKRCGFNLDRLIEVQNLIKATTGIKICSGWTPSIQLFQSSPNLNDQFLNTVNYDMKNGLKDILPSAIGEFDMSLYDFNEP